MLLAIFVMLVGASNALAQEAHTGDAAIAYHWVRSNAGPGECGCFGLNGGGVSGSWNYRGPWSFVADFSAENTSGAPVTGNSLTLTSYLAGARYRLPQPLLKGKHKPQAFAQVLLGAAHAGGGIAGIGDASFGFASRVGGGLDVPVSPRFAVRVVQLDYYLTTFSNATNDHQNNFLVGAGLVFHWSKQK
jgi:hypothetical protein